MTMLLILFCSSATAWLTVVTSFLINEKLFERTGQKQQNFQTWLSFTKTEPEWTWTVFASGNCSLLRYHAPHLECYLLPAHLHSLHFRVPFVNAILKRARMIARTRYLMFSNVDNVILGDLRRIVDATARETRLPHLFITSRPTAVHTNRAYNWQMESEQAQFRLVPRSEFEWIGWACEAFIIDRQNPMIDRMPPFLIGRIRWDNWVMQFAGMHNGTASVNAGDALTILHMNHGANGSYDMSAHSAPGTQYNEQLSISGGSYFYGNTICLRFLMSSQFVVTLNDLAKCKSFRRTDGVLYADVETYVNS